MEHLNVRREVAARRNPQVVEKLDPPLIPQPRKLALGLRAAQAVRSAAKEPGAVRVQLDPAALI